MVKGDLIFGWLTDEWADMARARGKRLKFCYFDRHLGLPVHRIA